MGATLSMSITQNSQRVSDCTSNVTVSVTINYNGGSHNATGECFGWITIDGMNYDFSGITFNESASSSGSKVIMTKTVDVYHDSDGTKFLSCSASFYTGISAGTITTSASKTLTTIARRSTLSAMSGYLGEPQTLYINSASSSFTHTITYECGSEYGTIATRTSLTEVTWTPPYSLANANPNGSSVTATLTLTTYSGSTNVGSHSISVFYTIGSGATPTFTVDFSDPTGYKDTYGYFVQLRSKLKITVNATAQHGADIVAYKIQANSETFSTEEATTSEIAKAGSIQVYVYVQDSRGRSAQDYFYVSVEAYSPPNVSSLTVKRCDEDGTENDQGEYVQAAFLANVTSLDGQNTASYKFEYKKTTDATYTTVELAEIENELYASGDYIFAADGASSYNVQLTVTDAFCSVAKTTTASTAATIMHFKSNGKGIGLGKISERDNVVDVGWHIRMNGNTITQLAEPINDHHAATMGWVTKYIKENILEYVYPVGSIFFTVEGISPEYIGYLTPWPIGTWETLGEGLLYTVTSSSQINTSGDIKLAYNQGNYDVTKPLMKVQAWVRVA